VRTIYPSLLAATFLAPAIDRQPQPGLYQVSPDCYRRAVKHEITHVVSPALARCGGTGIFALLGYRLPARLAVPFVSVAAGRSRFRRLVLSGVRPARTKDGSTSDRRNPADPGRISC
jgi:hypothetical protein